jgi:hypothetical protein
LPVEEGIILENFIFVKKNDEYEEVKVKSRF